MDRITQILRTPAPMGVVLMLVLLHASAVSYGWTANAYLLAAVVVVVVMHKERKPTEAEETE